MNGYSVLPVVLSVLSALGFSWPLFSRAAQLSPIMTAITYAVGTAVVIGVGSKFFEYGPVSTRAVALGMAAGLLNGLAMVVYSVLISNKEWDITVYLPLTVGLMLIFMTAGGIIFFHEAFTANKVAGITAILIGVYLLR